MHNIKYNNTNIEVVMTPVRLKKKVNWTKLKPTRFGFKKTCDGLVQYNIKYNNTNIELVMTPVRLQNETWTEQNWNQLVLVLKKLVMVRFLNRKKSNHNS